MLSAVWRHPPHRIGSFARIHCRNGLVVSPQLCPHPAAYFNRSHSPTCAGRSCPPAGDGTDRSMELELSAPAPVQHQCLCLPIQHPHGQELVQRGALCALHPGCGAGSALSQLAGRSFLVDIHQSALRQHPCPAGTLSYPAGGGWLSSQPPANPTGAGVFVWIRPAHLLFE